MTNDLLKRLPRKGAGKLERPLSGIDYPSHGEPPIRSALTFPSCDCRRCRAERSARPAAELKQQMRGRADDRSFSPTMQRLRPLIEKANERTQAGWF
jgi:hypothetical protein